MRSTAGLAGFFTLIMGAFAVWNVGIAFVVGVAAYWLNKRDLLRL
jgi:hypothetical protein